VPLWLPQDMLLRGLISHDDLWSQCYLPGILNGEMRDRRDVTIDELFCLDAARGLHVCYERLHH
jgi:hypothetical protein